jgi:hypothetical protein
MSDLTPEERRRIYLDEKARLEAQEQLREETQVKECQNKARAESERAKDRQRGYLVMLSILGVIGAIVMIFSRHNTTSSKSDSAPGTSNSSSQTNNPNPPSPAEVPESEKKANAKLVIEANKRFEECHEKLKKAQQLEALSDLEWKRAMPKVVVGPTFYSIPIDAKQGFADTVNCFLMTGKSNYIDFDLLDWQTGKRVARYSLGRLKMD